MKTTGAKTTIYLRPAVRKALKRRIIDTQETMSGYVERVLSEAIAEDLADAQAIDERRGGETETLDEFLTALKRDGVI
jgi:hypothetical protein